LAATPRAAHGLGANQQPAQAEEGAAPEEPSVGEVGGQRGTVHQPFSNRPFPNRACGFHRTRLSSGPCMDSQDRSGVTHLTYLYYLLSDPPVSLRLGLLPCGRLSRPLTTTETPFPWGSYPVGNPAFRASLTFRMV